MAQNVPAHLVDARCRCGHTVGHPSVEARPSHGFWAWVKLLNGIDTIPKKVVYRCRTCGTVLATTRDLAARREFR